MDTRPILNVYETIMWQGPQHQMNVFYMFFLSRVSTAM